MYKYGCQGGEFSDVLGRIEGIRISLRDLQFLSPRTGTSGKAAFIVVLLCKMVCPSLKNFLIGGLRGLCVTIKGTRA